MRILISGGCKNGKSFFGQRLAKAQSTGTMYYVATMQPIDSEDHRRIARHRQERLGWGFTTLEQPVDLENILSKCDHGGSFLLDSLTALLANEMFPANSRPNEQAAEKVAGELSRVLRETANIVVISDYIYSDALIYDPLTEKYRASLADLDRAVALRADVVLEMAYTHVGIHKGREAFGALFEKIR